MAMTAAPMADNPMAQRARLEQEYAYEQGQQAGCPRPRDDAPGHKR